MKTYNLVITILAIVLSPFTALGFVIGFLMRPILCGILFGYYFINIWQEHEKDKLDVEKIRQDAIQQLLKNSSN